MAEERKITAEESYKIIIDVLDKFYNITQTSEPEYVDFYKLLSEHNTVKVTNLTKIEKIKNELRKKAMELGIDLTDENLEKIMKKDPKHITNLSIDPYMNLIDRILDETKVAKRSEDKPMMTPRSQTGIGNSPSEAHLTTRGMHQKQVGDLSAEIAENLGLNVALARIGGKHHDDGHTNSGHTGERIATKIGKMNNCGYIVHNALSADMLISENVINKIISAIREKEPNMTEARKEEIAGEVWRILDIAISHNGEGKERIIRYNKNKTVEDIIRDKNECYRKEGYDREVLAGSKEGAIIAWADKLCYCSTDLQDGVNLGILKEFNDEYLKYIGILATKKEFPKLDELNEKVDSTRQKIPQELSQVFGKLNRLCNILFEEEDNIEKQLKETQKKLKQAKIDFDDPEKITEKTILKMEYSAQVNPAEYVKVVRKHMQIKKMVEEVFKATTECGRLYVGNIKEERRTEIVSKMIKDVCVKDLINVSKYRDYVGVSPSVAKAFFGVRSQNLEQIVQYTRRKFEKESLPQAELHIHEDLKGALLETGLIREYMNRVREIEEDENIPFELTEKERETRRKYGISENLEIKTYRKLHKGERYISPDKQLSTVLKAIKTSDRKYKYERKVCHRFIKLFKEQPRRVKEMYENALASGYDIALNDVEDALKQEKADVSELLGKEYYEKVLRVKAEIKEQYPNGFSNDEEKKAYARALADRRKNNRGEILAAAVALEYVAGMSDGTVLEASKLKGYLTDEIILEGYKREGKPEKQLADMQKFWNQKESANIEVANAIENCLRTMKVKIKKVSPYVNNDNDER